jgi:TRAP-type C4-dicarboxylate transport system permease small subunit
MGPGKMKGGGISYSKLVEKIVNTAGVVGAFLLLIITIFTFYEVIMRYIFKAPTTWSIDYSIYLNIWGTFMGAAFTLKQGAHISVDIIIKKFSARIRNIIEIIIYILILIFCIILTLRGFVSCLHAYLSKEITISFTRTPFYIPFLSIPVGGSLLILEIIRQIILKIRPERF